MAENREQIIRTEYSEIMQKSYIDYAMSVIIARALPDVRDGLKPVQRRTLYDMHELGIRGCTPNASKRTTVPGSGADGRPDLVGRDFESPVPTYKLVGDITYLRTGEG